MRSFGIDIGQQKAEIGEWTRDCYGLSDDGVPKLLSNDSYKESSRTVILFNNREVTACDHVGSRIGSVPDSGVTGCFNLLYPLTDESLRFENTFSPCELTSENGMTHCVLACGGEPKTSVPCIVPATFLFEYMFYLSMKQNKDLYYAREERCKEAVSSNSLFTFAIPDAFSSREISLLSCILDEMHCHNYAFVRTWVAIALEYGYYNNKSGSYDKKPRHVLFFESGASHTTLFLVRFSKNAMHLEALQTFEGVSGRQVDWDLLQFISREHPLSFSEHSKQFVRFMETIEKTKRELCLEGAEEMTIDVSDFFDEEDDLTLSFDQFASACQQTTHRLQQQLDVFLTTLREHSLVIDALVPVGGNTRVPFFFRTVETAVKEYAQQSVKVEHTVNVDDCVALGAILAGHLLKEKRIVVDEKDRNTLFSKWSCFDPRDTTNTLFVSSGVSEQRTTSPVVLSEEDLKCIQTTVERVHRAEKAMHDVHALCSASERMLQSLKETSVDLSFLEATPVKRSSTHRGKWEEVPQWAFPSEEFDVLCWLQNNVGDSFEMPVWRRCDDWILRNMTVGLEGEEWRLTLDFIKTEQLSKRMVLGRRLANVYPTIQRVARRIAQLKECQEKKDRIIADMEKLIYSTPRAKLNVEEMKRKSACMKECLEVIESFPVIREMLIELKRYL